MLNPNIFSRYCQKAGERREQGEQPHEYRCISVPSTKNDKGTNHENVAPVLSAKNDEGTEITASILVVPSVPPVLSKNMSEIKNGEIQTIFNITSDRNGKAGEGFPVPARQTPDVFCCVTPVLRNRRRRVAGSDTLDDGNSGHLKREPYPFQRQGTLPFPKTDAIPRTRIRVFYNALTMRLQSVAYRLPMRCRHIHAATYQQLIGNALSMRCKRLLKDRQPVCNRFWR